MLEEARSPAQRYAVDDYFDEGRDHAHSLNYKRANYVNDDFVASSEAALFESGSAGASRYNSLGNVVRFEKNEQTVAQPGAMTYQDPLAMVSQASAQYQPIPMDLGMKLSESLCGQVVPAGVEPEPHSVEADHAVVPAATACLSVSSTDSKSDSLFTVTKRNQKLIYLEDKAQIGEIFDKALFDRISEVEYIKETEQQLEAMKSNISDKKRLQKERNVLTAQLSRDRKKIEIELLREEAVQLTAKVNVLRNRLSSIKCQSCCELADSVNFIFDNSHRYLDNSATNMSSKDTANINIEIDSYAGSSKLIKTTTD